jgi:hypothetical protein
MINVFAVAFKRRMYFLFAEVQGICPIYVSIFHQYNIGIITVILCLEETIVEARISHKSNIV